MSAAALLPRHCPARSRRLRLLAAVLVSLSVRAADCRQQSTVPRPFNVAAVASDRSVCLSWQMVPTPLPVASYAVRVEPVFTPGVQQGIASSQMTEYTIPQNAPKQATVFGLFNGYTYNFYVRAMLVNGEVSEESGVVDQAPRAGFPKCDGGTPPPPTAPPPTAPPPTFKPPPMPRPYNVVVIAGDRAACLSWEYPGNSAGAPIRSYSIQAIPNSQVTATAAQQQQQPAFASNAAVIKGLRNGVTYEFYILAIAADGERSDNSDVTFGTPRNYLGAQCGGSPAPFPPVPPVPAPTYAPPSPTYPPPTYPGNCIQPDDLCGGFAYMFQGNLFPFWIPPFLRPDCCGRTRCRYMNWYESRCV